MLFIKKMNVWLNLNGTRDRTNRPKIDFEDSAKFIRPYDPHAYHPEHIYEYGGQPPAVSWFQEIQSWPSKTPVEVYSERTNSFYRYPWNVKDPRCRTRGCARRYESLAENASFQN